VSKILFPDTEEDNIPLTFSITNATGISAAMMLMYS